MAYIDPNQEDLDKQQQQGGNPNPAGNDSPSTSTGVGDPSSAPTYSASAPTSGTGSTGFQNLQSYLDANQGNNLSGQLAGKVSSQADKARNDLRGAEDSFKGSVDQNAVQQDQDNITRVLQNPNSASAADTTRFQQQLNANYQGPQNAVSYSPFQQAQSEGQNAYNSAQVAKTEGGRLSLLDKFFGTPNYTQGERGLDSALLLGGDQTDFNNLQDQVQNFPSEFQSSAQSLDQYANQGSGNTAASRAAARKAIGIDDAGNLTHQGTDAYGNPLYQGAFGDIENAVQSRVGQSNQTAADEYGRVSGALKDRNLISLKPDELKSFGIQPGSRLYNVDPTAYLTQNAVNATNNTAITSEEQARLSALYNLAGAENTFAPNASLAGTSQNPYQFNSQGYQSAVDQGKNAYENALDDTYVNLPNSSFSNPSSDRMKLNDAMSFMEPHYTKANDYLAQLIKMGQDPRNDTSGARETVAQYNQLRTQLNALKNSYGFDQFWKIGHM